MFASGNRHRFNTPAWKKSRCCKLIVNGEVVSDPKFCWRCAWSTSASRQSQGVMRCQVLAELQQKVDGLALQSIENNDMLFDIPFSAEVSASVRKLNVGKRLVLMG